MIFINNKKLNDIFTREKIVPLELTAVQLKKLWQGYLIPQNDKKDHSEAWVNYFEKFLHQGGLLFNLTACCATALHKRNLGPSNGSITKQMYFTVSDDTIAIEERVIYTKLQNINQEDLQPSGNDDYLFRAYSKQSLSLSKEKSSNEPQHQILDVRCQVNHSKLRGLLDNRDLLTRLVDFFKQLFSTEAHPLDSKLALESADQISSNVKL